MPRQAGYKLGPRERDYWQIYIDICEKKGEYKEAADWRFRQKYSLYNLELIKPYLAKYGERAGFVYVLKTLKGTPMYKIGKTRNLFGRVNSYNSNHKTEGVKFLLIRYTEDCDLVEKLLLALFKEKIARGNEWFWLSDEDIDLLRKHFYSKNHINL